MKIARGFVLVALSFYLLSHVLTIQSSAINSVSPGSISVNNSKIADSKKNILKFKDNFSKPSNKWNLEKGWSIKKVNGNPALYGEGHKWARLNHSVLSNYGVKFKFKLLEGNVHINYRAQDAPGGMNRYFIAVNKNGIWLNKQKKDDFKFLIAVYSGNIDGNWHDMEIRGYNGTINIFLDGTLHIAYKDDSYIRSGITAFETLKDGRMLIDDLEIKTVNSNDVSSELGELKVSNTNRAGTLRRDEIWSGEITVTGHITVPKGKKLTIEPGTVVKFNPSRDYKDFNQMGISVDGGILKAVGTPAKQIWFTSSSKSPINGDWGGITVKDSTESKFDYVIVEYGQLGIVQLDSSVTISNSIIRWSNSEGLYAERSSPVIINNTLYENGYHEIALEQYNNNVIIRNNIIRDGHYGIHLEKTSATIEGNYFLNEKNSAITAGMESSATIKGNKFVNIGSETIAIYGNSVSNQTYNDFGDGSVSIPVFDYSDLKDKDLGYIPGDPEDKFAYIYDDEDDTRKVLKKLGKEFSFGWSLEYANNYLWRFSLGSGTIGKELDFIQIDYNTGEYKLYGNDVIMNPRGLTYDGEFFWVNDFSLLKIFKFKIESDFVKIYASFDIPEKELGGTMGMTGDGNYLYMISRGGSKIYKIDKTGDVVGEILIKDRDIGNALVWTGKYFWAVGGSKGLGKYDINGNLVGEIYPAADGTWALAWDGKYLWTIQRTCESWNDPKIYQIDIKNDSITE